jgi:microcystin-dependent protein
MAKYRANASEPFKTLKIKALDSMVIGSIIQFVGATIPTGWLECDGSTITQSDYPELYNLIGGTLPDFRGRVLVGQDTNDTDFDTLLETGGSKALQSHAHELQTSAGANYVGMVSTAYSGDTGWAVTTDAGTKSGGNILGGTTRTAGQGNSGNLQPYAVVKHIIKATNTTPTMASIVDTYSTSTQDGYSCDYINKALDNKVVLYENSTGTNGSITLSDDASNYSYLMVYWRSTWNSTRQGVAMAPPSANKWSLFESVVGAGSDSAKYTNIAIYYIGDTSFNLDKASDYGNGSSNTFYITKIVGYK